MSSSWNRFLRSSPSVRSGISRIGKERREVAEQRRDEQCSRWNQLDTMIVILSIAGIVMEKMKSGHILPINPTLIRVMRVLRIARGNRQIPLCNQDLSLFSRLLSSETIENGQRDSSSLRYCHSSSSSSWQLGNCSLSLSLEEKFFFYGVFRVFSFSFSSSYSPHWA